jgi:hypothetical protein
MIACSTPAVRVAVMACGIALTLVGCAEERPQSTISRNLDSGVTSSYGGGMPPANFGSSAPIRTSR